MLCIKAKAQEQLEVLDANYKPKGDDEKALYQQKCTFMLTVFDKKLKTDQAKETICLYMEKPYAAQLIFKIVKGHAKKSTGAEVATSNLLSYLTTTKLGSQANELEWYPRRLRPQLVRQVA